MSLAPRTALSVSPLLPGVVRRLSGGRARWTRTLTTGATAVVIPLLAACSPAAEPAEAEGPASAPQSPPPSEVDARPVPTPSGGASTEPVEPLALPESCAETGLTEHMAAFADRLSEPDFEEVRTDVRLECSWAGFSRDDWSEVIMVTYAPAGSRVEYPGHVPASVAANPDFFTTAEVAELGGIAQWRRGGVFSGVSLHLPGLQVTSTSNAERISDEDLLDVSVATARDLLGSSDG
ncbi:hypothetical protein [Marinitenerispora sediminis]|uniref:DUF3558 domain-containing protein n=1 Tax=Marinitenerispora sediminis TaxID=1931232 RepID=A0A368T0W0_9ACTN|nr:hypothetical protein [Marinitenerispora sediminis]RCV49954.1 hypothetical protein DEF28_19425 [Marinitenerispora sediminis]RCV51065.1 hypothetical protein DEF23_21130 [Marinitenerispora sediminis]RCV53325.1 hypothetical protein DEF24_20810 [Marinitenerispora sediminis]